MTMLDGLGQPVQIPEIYKQEAPFSIQVEFAEGCQLRCAFCGLNGIRGKDNDYKFMTTETLDSLFSQIVELDWNPRIEIAMHGEPTMHPSYVEMIGRAYAIAPTLQLMLTTNGGGLLRPPGPAENIKALFRNGLNILALDDYEGVKIVSKIRPHLDDICRELNIDWYEYPKQPEGNPHRRHKYPFISILQDISLAEKGTHSALSNHAGAAAPLNMNQYGARCHRPFRELSVRWDGNVAICCNDWRGDYKCGNVVTDGLLNVWHSAAFHAARQKLIRGERTFTPCYGCDARSMRVGLLPDKMGKDAAKLTPPDVWTYMTIATALDGPSLATKVNRPWEMNDHQSTDNSA